MEDRRAVVARELEQVGITAGIGTRAVFVERVILHRSGGRDRAGELEPGHRGLAVEFRRQVVGSHRRRLAWIVRLDADGAARGWPQLAHRHREARPRMRRSPGHLGRQRREVELHVGRERMRHRAREQPALVDADRKRPAALEDPLEAHAELAHDAAQVVVGGHRLRAAEDRAHLQMILQVLADAGQCMHHRDAAVGQQRGVADARQLQQLRRLQPARREHHFVPCTDADRAAALRILDARCTAAYEQHTVHHRLGLDAQVGPASRRLQVRDRSRAAQAVARGQLVVARAFLCRAVEVVVARNADFAGAGDERVHELMGLADVGGAKRTVAAVVIGRAARVALAALEVRQHVVPGPALVAERSPVVVILALAADEDEAVDRARPTQTLAARPVDLPAVHRRLGLGLEHPVPGRMEHGLRIPDRHMDPRVPVALAGFQQQYAVAAALGQPVGEHAAGRARADDDEVVLDAVGSGDRRAGEGRDLVGR